MALESLDDRPQALNLTIGARQLVGLFEDDRAQRLDVIGKVSFHEHGDTESAPESPVNRQSAELVGGARHAPAASPDLREERPIALPSRALPRPGCPAT